MVYFPFRLQREGTIALWKREKQKILNNLSGRETRLDNDLKDAKEELDDVRYRLQKRIKVLRIAFPFQFTPLSGLEIGLTRPLNVQSMRVLTTRPR